MKKRLRIVLAVVLICAVFICGVYCGYRLIRHERIQSQQIAEMQATISKLSLKINSLSENDVEWLEDGINYLAIGNSITLHPINSFWWNEIGMAASDAQYDYFHIVLSHLGGGVQSTRK